MWKYSVCAGYNLNIANKKKPGIKITVLYSHARQFSKVASVKPVALEHRNVVITNTSYLSARFSFLFLQSHL